MTPTISPDPPFENMAIMGWLTSWTKTRLAITMTPQKTLIKDTDLMTASRSTDEDAAATSLLTRCATSPAVQGGEG